MVGFITERHLTQAEEAFPGIARFFAALPRKPQTFLELVSLFERWPAPRGRRPPRSAGRDAAARP